MAANQDRAAGPAQGGEEASMMQMMQQLLPRFDALDARNEQLARELQALRAGRAADAGPLPIPPHKPVDLHAIYVPRPSRS